ncbi:MAG: nucleotidyltransferase family protein [Solirubrobacterales bacterium]
MDDEPRGLTALLASGDREDINRIASEGRSLLDLVALGDDLEKALGVAVDVVTENSLSPYLRDRILAEAVAV